MSIEKATHLEIVSRTISRMEGNSLTIKALAIAMTIVFAVVGGEYAVISVLPIFALWFLDAYYLRQEYLHRSVFDRVRQAPKDEVDFCISPDEEARKDKKNSIKNCMLSKTQLWLYLALVFVCFVMSLVEYSGK